MKKILIANIMVAVLACGPASAWSHAGGYSAGVSHNNFGGSTAHVAGEGTTHTSAAGTSSTHYAGPEGGYSTHTNEYGATTTGKAGYGAVTTGPGGAASVYHPPAGAYPAGSYAYHPPVVVNSYSAGCYNCGGWSAGAAAATGVAVGVVAGAAIASSNNSAAQANAYAAGVAAGYQMGQVVPVIPSTGCAPANVAGQPYYLCGSTWLMPAYGANGVYYRVVPAP
jgi:hypothetical protein